MGDGGGYDYPHPASEKIKSVSISLDDDDDKGDDDDMDCKKCGHQWVPIVDKPLKCPSCNQPKYWVEKVRNVGRHSSVVERPLEGSPIPTKGGSSVRIPGAAPSNLSSHDPKTCRIYKCGLCAAKEK